MKVKKVFFKKNGEKNTLQNVQPNEYFNEVKILDFLAEAIKNKTIIQFLFFIFFPLFLILPLFPQNDYQTFRKN